MVFVGVDFFLMMWIVLCCEISSVFIRDFFRLVVGSVCVVIWILGIERFGSLGIVVFLCLVFVCFVGILCLW